MKNEKINKYLEELKKNNIINNFYYGKFNYWDGVPYIVLNNGKSIALAKTYFCYRSLGIKTIKDYKNITYIKQKIKKTIENGYFK